MTKCPTCFDVTLGYNTGEAGQRGTLDCADCDTATERAAFNNSMSDVCLTRKDQDWHAYQLGRAMESERAAAQVKLIRVLAVGEVIVTPDATIQNNSAHPIRIIQRADSVEIPSPEQESELVSMLLKMWGHAIELGETDYFDDPQFAKADWSADCAAAAKLIAKYK